MRSKGLLSHKQVTWEMKYATPIFHEILEHCNGKRVSTPFTLLVLEPMHAPECQAQVLSMG